ncbi:Ycf51 family protein [cf. Phormidesmis sp. LEGE 11477]|nr:Ycf51 family protein [cf. Phormidesmis sp. LEGE 11477]
MLNLLMLTPDQFLAATGYFVIGTIAFGLLTALSFLLKWGIRFRLVGATGFMGVLTVGLFGLSFQPLTSAQIPGAVPYTTVFDSGSSQIVIAVPNTITRTELEATLEQAASNLLKPSRLRAAGQRPLIRARVIAHRDGISDLLYIGSVKPGEGNTPAERTPIVEIYPDKLAKANNAAA